jgi:hypothetical protein
VILHDVGCGSVSNTVASTYTCSITMRVNASNAIYIIYSITSTCISPCTRVYAIARTPTIPTADDVVMLLRCCYSSSYNYQFINPLIYLVTNITALRYYD